MLASQLAPLAHGILETLGLMAGFTYYRYLRTRAGAASTSTARERFFSRRMGLAGTRSKTVGSGAGGAACLAPSDVVGAGCGA